MPLSSNFLGGITSPLGSLIAPSPASALNEIKQRAALYNETKDEAHLVQVRAVIQYVKVYQKITAGMSRKERRRAITNPKWSDDVPSLGIYEFVYSDKELTIEDSQRVRHEIIAAWGEKTPVVYPQLTAEHIKTLKHALLLTGKYLDFDWHRTFIVLGTYYLDNRADHPIYKPASPVKIKVAKTPGLVPEHVPIGCALPPAMAAARAMNASFGGPTSMQLEIRDAAIAQKHPVTQSEIFRSSTLLMQCYMAQGAGVTASPVILPTQNTPLETEDGAISVCNRIKETRDEDAILKKLASDVLKTASISSFETPSTLTDIVDRGAEVIEAGLSKLEMGLDKSKETLRRVLSVKKKSGLTRVQEIQKSEGYVPHVSPMGDSSALLASIDGKSECEGGDEFAVREPELGVGGSGGFGTGSLEEEFPMREYAPIATTGRGVHLYDGYFPDTSLRAVHDQNAGEVLNPYIHHHSSSNYISPSHNTESRTTSNYAVQEPLDATSSSRPSPNMSLNSIVQNISTNTAEVDENTLLGSGRDRRRSFLEKAKDLVGQSEKSKMREQRREKRSKFEFEE